MTRVRRGILLTGVLLGAALALSVVEGYASTDDKKSDESLNKVDTGFFLLLNKIDTGFFLLLDNKEKPHPALNRVDTGFFLLLDRKDPIPASEVELGRRLFFDPRLSANRTMSCATCHVPDQAWSDGKPRAVGLLKNPLQRNTPTLLNVHHYQQRFFWDGRASTLEEATLTAMQSRLEMNRDVRELVRDLNKVPEYAHAFSELYGLSGVTPENTARAVAQFIRAEVRPGETPFDKFRKDRKAMSDSAVRGLELFTAKAGCVRCHSGPAFSDAFFHNTGLKPLPGVDDVGRYAVAPAPMTWRAFRTVALRNVELTAPYMHDGSLATLEDVVEFYDRGGDVKEGQDALMRPLGLTAREKKDLVSFMKALTAAPKPAPAPKLPADGGPATAAQAVEWDQQRLAMAEHALKKDDRLGLWAAAEAIRENALALQAFSGKACAGDVQKAAFDLGTAASKDAAVARRALDFLRETEAVCASEILGKPGGSTPLTTKRERFDGAACRKTFSVDGLIGDLDKGKFSESERRLIEADIVEAASTYWQYRAFAKNDPELCRKLGGLRNTNFGISQSAEWFCREWFYDLATAQAMMMRLPDLESRCRRSHAHDYPSATKEEREEICGIVAKHVAEPEVLCGKLTGRYMGGENMAACVNEFKRYGSESYIGESQKGAPEMMYKRYVALDLFAKAWRAKDIALCGDSEACRVLMGDGERLAPRHAELVKEAYCGLRERRSGPDGAR